jgi:hypothetical protein
MKFLDRMSNRKEFNKVTLISVFRLIRIKIKMKIITIGKFNLTIK